MAVKDTIAFIGVENKTRWLLEKLAAQNFPIILVAGEEVEKNHFSESFQKEILDAEIEVLDCPKNGCWEADIIAFVGSENFEMNLLLKIEEFATQKIIMFISKLNEEKATFSVVQLQEIQETLPNSKIVPVLINPEAQKVFVSGEDPAAVEKVNFIFETIGFEIGNKV